METFIKTFSSSLTKIFVLLILFFNNFIYFYLSISGCAGSSLMCRLFSSCGEQGLLSTCGVQASHCGGFSCC